MRTQIFSCNSPRSPYFVENGVLGCTDRRVASARHAFLTANDIHTADPIIVPGGILNVAYPKHLRDRELLLDMVANMKSAHGANHWYFMAHNHCLGANHCEDLEFYERALLDARAAAVSAIPGIRITLVLEDFNALFRVD